MDGGNKSHPELSYNYTAFQNLDIFQGIKQIDTTKDLILGVVLLVLSIMLTFICCVTLAAKCSRGPRSEFEPAIKLQRLQISQQNLLQQQALLRMEENSSVA